MEHRHLDTEHLLHVRGEHASERRELGEHQHPTVLSECLGDDPVEPFDLAGAVTAVLTDPGPVAAEVCRVVADLLEVRQCGEHQTATSVTATVGQSVLDVRGVRLVQRRLLGGHGDRVDVLALLRQPQIQGRIRLLPPQDERVDEPVESLDVLRVPVPLDVGTDGVVEGLRRAQQPGITEIHEGVQLRQPVLHRGTAERDAVVGRDRPDRPRLRGARVLDVLRLIGDHPTPPQTGVAGRVASHGPVGRQHQIHRLGRGRELLLRHLARAVVHQDAQRRHMPGDLRVPCLQHRGRGHDEGGTGRLTVLAFPGQQGKDLQSLTQAHVIGEDRAEPVAEHPHQPVETPLLVVTQRDRQGGRRLHPLRRGEGRHLAVTLARVLGGEHPADPALGVDLKVLVGVPGTVLRGQFGGQQVAERHQRMGVIGTRCVLPVLPVLLRRLLRLSHRAEVTARPGQGVPVQAHVPALDLHHGARRGEQVMLLQRTELFAVDRDVPVEGQHLLHTHASLRRPGADRRDPHLHRRTHRGPATRHEHVDTGHGQRRHPLGQQCLDIRHGQRQGQHAVLGRTPGQCRRLREPHPGT